MAPIDEENEKLKYSHFSHNHPLEQAVSSQTDNTTCSGCKKVISVGKVYYTCKSCRYSLHSACYKMPILFQHVSEPGHDLNLLVMQSFECRGCGLEGSGFCYHCRTCVANYHTLCIRMPLSVSSASHQHELKIQFAPPYGYDIGFCCDVCKKTSSSLWLYRCNECNFDVHLNCVFAAPSPPSPPQNLPRTESRGAVQSINCGVALSSPIPSGCQNSAGKLQSQNSSLSGPVSPMMLGGSPFSRDSRSRILDTLDQRLCRVQRPMRISMEENLRRENGVRTNTSSSLQGVGN